MFVVPAGHEAVSASRRSPVSHQHLPGGRHPHVVPVERAERLHPGHLELRILPRLQLRADQPDRTDR